jgi:hypothetical protein
MRKGLNYLIIFTTWEVWKHRNDYVFTRARLEERIVIQSISNEGILWCRARATGLSDLMNGSLQPPFLLPSCSLSCCHGHHRERSLMWGRTYARQEREAAGGAGSSVRKEGTGASSSTRKEGMAKESARKEGMAKESD